MNKINRNLLEVFTNGDIKKEYLGGIFSRSNPNESAELVAEIFELSKLLVLQDRSIQSVIFEETDECTGLYILQDGTLGGHILNRSK